MMITTQDIISQINSIAPFDISEPWDNSGLQAGNRQWEVKKIIIGLDVTLPLMEAAVDTGADLVLTHHPLIMSPEKQIDFARMPGCAIKISAENEISIVCAHTNLDKASAGLNDFFADKIGLDNLSAFVTDDPGLSGLPEPAGIGRIGTLPSELSLEQLVAQVKKKLKLDHLRVTGQMTQLVNKVAVCTGSGGSLIDEFIRSKADVYITGDIKYHEARKAEEFSKSIIDVGHFGSELIAIDLLFNKLTHAFEMAGFDIELVCFKNEKDPFTIV